MKAIIWVTGLAIAVASGAALFAWSGAYNVAADEPHWRLTERVMETVRDRSIAAGADRVDVPDLSDESLIRAGAGNYDAMCVRCHLRPGLEGTELSRGLNPAPPDLGRRGIEDPAAAFWTVKHGIKMSGMPAWGRHMEDHYIWGVVAFLQKLPGMTPDDYHELVESSGGHSHGETGADEHEHEDESHHAH